jgi:hypothetical protein
MPSVREGSYIGLVMVITRYGLPSDDGDDSHAGYQHRSFEKYVEIQVWSDEPIGPYRSQLSSDTCFCAMSVRCHSFASALAGVPSPRLPVHVRVPLRPFHASWCVDQQFAVGGLVGRTRSVAAQHEHIGARTQGGRRARSRDLRPC